MRQRIVYYLAAAAVLAAGIAGALRATATPIPAQAMTVTSGLEIISGNDRAETAAPDHQVLAGFNSTKVGTEIFY